MFQFLEKKDSKKLEKAIEPNQYSIEDENRKVTYVIIRAESSKRTLVRSNVEKNLRTQGLKFAHKTGGGSIGTTEIFFDYHAVKINYKPISGGMQETTLNSTITELAPAIAFASGAKKFKDVNQYYKFITESKNVDVYVNQNDAQAGSKFIDAMPSSSKFKEKMENAMAVLDYLNKLNSEMPIRKIYWGYRAKPAGIPSNHKGDLFVLFGNNKYMGISLKAGGEKTAEPQLNTYVNKFFDDFGNQRAKNALIRNVYQQIHSRLGLSEDWQEKNNKLDSIKTINIYKRKYPSKYEDLYDQMLDIIRNSLVSTINNDMQGTIAYIEKQILKKDNDVPLVVIKAFGKNFKQVTDEDALGAFLPKTTSIKAYPSASSKQNWHIELKAGKNDRIVMNMTVRSNKTEPENKVAQGFNLAIKFNGITKK